MESEYQIIRKDDSINIITRMISFHERLLLSLALLFKREIKFRDPIVKIYGKGDLAK